MITTSIASKSHQILLHRKISFISLFLVAFASTISFNHVLNKGKLSYCFLFVCL